MITQDNSSTCPHEIPTQLEQAKTLIKTILQTAICDNEFPSLVKKLLKLTSTINHTPDGSVNDLTWKRLADFYHDMKRAYGSGRFIDETVLNESIVKRPL